MGECQDFTGQERKQEMAHVPSHVGLEALAGARDRRAEASLRPECLHPQAEIIFPFYTSRPWWFLPGAKVFCWSCSWLSCRYVSSVLCLCYSDARGMGGVRGPHSVSLESRTSCLGVARTFCSPYHTAVGILRQIGPYAVRLWLSGGDSLMCC